ncbi:phage minor head protein [Clostridium sporogenes]|uniref:Phage minor head protein n=1 Tax=Clostridium sporogenes TaxID=1509 RepID=A0AAE4JU91_CLOSG|nr:phage minor head protein [Clostridium sporogenes]MDS1004178.1 phage minor head protein [Clostridium sporogenes]
MNKDERFIKGLYDEAEEEMGVVYDKQKENREELLKEIALIMLTYTVLKDVMNLKPKDRNKEFARLTNIIGNATRGQAALQEKTIFNILTDITGKTFNFYSYNANLKDVRKIVESNFKGKHFSTRVWDNEQKVSKYLESQIKNFLDGKIGVNDIKKNIEEGFYASKHNAERLVETEINRCSSTAFNRFCEEVGVEKVRYNAILDGRTCPKCSPHHDKPFDFDKKIELPQHARCRCFYEIIK